MPFRDPDNRLAEIRRLAAKIPTPTDYLHGVTTPVGKLPGNIICFVRNSVDELLKPAARQRTQHHRCVLLVALRGSGRVCIDSENFQLQPGQAQLIFPFQFHSYMECAPDDICWVFVTFESFSLATLSPLRSSPSRVLGSTELVLLHELIQCWLNKKRHRLLPLHLGLLLERLAMSGADRKTSATTPAGTDTDLLMRVNSHILSRLNQPLGLKELAHAMRLSESHLRARFRAATGYSIGRHIRHLRLQQACSLLHSTGLSIGEVSEHCGFESIYSFSRTFKMDRGVSPSDYRRGMHAVETD